MTAIAEDGDAETGDVDLGAASTPDHVIITLAKLLDCCAGAQEKGAAYCMCWEPVHDRPQQPLDLAAEPVVRDGMCVDCAYRPDSPEKSGDPSYRADADELERIAACEVFWCHEGLRKPQRWRHPAGVEILGHPGGYVYDGIDGVPFKADGRPADKCAGWDARRRALRARRR